MPDNSKKPASASEIRGMIGDIDDAVVTSILRTVATAAEVLQAAEWFRGDRGLEDEGGHEPHGAVRAVYEILAAEEPDEP
jgi:hypothetical protein